MNKFTEESAFLAHYERARKIARFPGNHIRVCDGENLLGWARKSEYGHTVIVNGKVLWDEFPRAGYIPDTAGGAWQSVQWLAHHLQSTLVRMDDRHAVSLRVTPEIRVELKPHTAGEKMLIRTLTVEIRARSDSPIGIELAREFKQSAIPYVKLWYPLHERVQDEIVTADDVTPADDGFTYANLQLRFRANHEHLPGATT
jgi:hypothetical protein